MFRPKISIVTVTLNSSETIAKCIASVTNQTYADIEHIIIDGASKDNTIDIIKSFPSRVKKIVSEPDKGIYDAMNKGIKLATGDIVGILNSDDFLCNDNVIETIVMAFINKDVDAIYGDVQFINATDTNKIVRFYSSRNFSPKKFKFGFMPAHPSFYVKKENFEKFGYYKEDYKIAADFELLMRFLLINKIRSEYIGKVIVSMRTGGISNKSIKSNYILNKEIYRACKENGIKTNYVNIYSKYLIKVFELLGNRK
jgi:glycosyltransferase involved in cell wall biosynthesis